MTIMSNGPIGLKGYVLLVSLEYRGRLVLLGFVSVT